MKEPQSPQELLALNEAFHRLGMASEKLRMTQRILVAAEEEFRVSLRAFRLLFEKEESVD